MTADHIHTPDDGRSYNRKVLVDGNPVDFVVYADTMNGVVRAYEKPLRVDGDEFATYELRGQVEVVTA